MEFELKTLSPDAVPRALEKAVRYRLLNEPGEAASICLDVLAADAGQPGGERHADTGADRSVRGEEGTAALAEAWECLERIQDEYSHAVLRRHHLGAPREGASAPRHARCRRPRATNGCARRWPATSGPRRCGPPGNDDALLRWNACARLIMRDRRLVPAEEERGEPLLLE